MGLCERCKKSHATFHLTNIDTDGEKAERHLCERCAVKEGLMHVQKPTVNVSDVLESFVASTREQSGGGGLVCEHCGMSYVEFRNQGLLGCPHDYDSFEGALTQIIERAQGGGSTHTGKTPKSLGRPRVTQQDIRKLQRQLEEAVAAEDYERAAELRDRIAKVEQA